MINNDMKVKSLFILLLIIAVVISFFTLIFEKEHKVSVIKNIDAFIFNDSIVFVHYYKDDYGPGVETRLKNFDTSFCFSGRNEKVNLLYLDYAKKGDIIIKEKNADTFYVNRNDSTVKFVLSRCQ